MDGALQMKTTQGPRQIDVIYRRIDDDFLDPLVFRPDSVLGVPGLFDLYRAGRVTIVNAPGGGIADDKAIYSYIPEIIKFYTGRAPILQNVPTYNCRKPDELKYVLEQSCRSWSSRKCTARAATACSSDRRRRRRRSRPSATSSRPTPATTSRSRRWRCRPARRWSRPGVAPRHLDLRPFVLFGDEVRLTSGGLTRVALREGSLVVNSSQGGGTKDTWVLQD